MNFWWQGNVVVPAAGIVTDGHLIMPLMHVDPLVVGVLLERPTPEWDDATDTEIPPREVPPEAAWNLWDRHIAAPMMPLTWGGTLYAIDGMRLCGIREDLARTWIRPHLLAIARAALPALTRATQHASGPLAPIVLWSDADQPVGVLMPLRVQTGDPPEGYAPLTFELLRPADTRAEKAPPETCSCGHPLDAHDGNDMAIGGRCGVTGCACSVYSRAGKDGL